MSTDITVLTDCDGKVELSKCTVKSLSHSQFFAAYGLQPTRFLCPWDFPGKDTGMLPFPSPGDLPDPGIKSGSPELQADSLLTGLPGKLLIIHFSNTQKGWPYC